jgi:hypothetical protein
MPRVNKSGTGRKGHRWVAQVKTDSTHPPAGLFTKDPATIARLLASRKVSPKGPGSGMRRKRAEQSAKSEARACKRIIVEGKPRFVATTEQACESRW